MNRVSEDLYPMRVNPLNFKAGDVVKKIYGDDIKTPYVGVVTHPIPSTNKVEVMWPHGMGMEDPWDLIKVNPIIDPPVVDQDKSYKTYQNQQLRAEQLQKCRDPYRILKEHFRDNMKPMLLHAADLYNKGYSKSAAYKTMLAEHHDKTPVVECLNRVFNDEVDIFKNKEIIVGGKVKYAHLSLVGNSDHSFKVSYFINDSEGTGETLYFDNLIKATQLYNKYDELLDALSVENKAPSIVAHVNRIKNLKEE